MRIVWSSNAPWVASGYGVQSHYLIPRFQALGHTLAVHAWYGLQGGMLTLNDVPVYPGGLDPYGNDTAEAVYRHFEADLYISLIDAWVLRGFGRKKMRWCPYMPIDQEPVPEAILESIKGAYRVISYSKWAERLLNDCGVSNIYIPHGVDTQEFAPADKGAAKRNMGFDGDEFVIGMVAANKGLPSRKAFPENLQAVKVFMDRHPREKVRLYLHTLEGEQTGGVNFNALLQNLGFQKAQVRFPKQFDYFLGLSPRYLANAYNAMDVLLASTMGEGFGIPIIEAQACGTPVITTNFSAMPELTFAGWGVQPAQRFWTGLNSWMVMPSVDSIVEALECAWEARGSDKLRRIARRGAQAYDWDAVVSQYWQPFLETIEKGLSVEASMLARIPSGASEVVA